MAQEGSLDLVQGSEDTDDESLTARGVAYELERMNRIAGNNEIMRGIFGGGTGGGEGGPVTGKARHKKGSKKREKEEKKGSTGEGEVRKSARTKIQVEKKPVDKPLGEKGGWGRGERRSGKKGAGEVKGVGEIEEEEQGKGCGGVKREMEKMLTKRTAGKETADLVWEGWGDEDSDEDDKRRKVRGGWGDSDEEPEDKRGKMSGDAWLREDVQPVLKTSRKEMEIVPGERERRNAGMEWNLTELHRECKKLYGNAKKQAGEWEKEETCHSEGGRYEEEGCRVEEMVKDWSKRAGKQSRTVGEGGRHGQRGGSVEGEALRTEVQGMGVGTEVQGQAICEYLSGQAREEQW